MAHVSEDNMDETPLGMSEINPLLVPLEAVQVDFLETVWDSIARAHAPHADREGMPNDDRTHGKPSLVVRRTIALWTWRPGC